MSLKWISRMMLVLLALIAVSPRARAQDAEFLRPFMAMSPDAARDLYNAGKDLYDAQKYADAEKKLREVVAKFPKNAITDRSDYLLMRTLVKLGKVNEALSRANEFDKLYPRSDWRSDVRELRINLTHEVPPGGEVMLRLQVPPSPPTPPAPATPPAPPAPSPMPSPGMRLIGPGQGIGRAPRTSEYRPGRVEINDPEVSLQQEILRALFMNSADRAIEIATERLKSDPSDPVVLSNLNMVASSHSAKALPMLLEIAKGSSNGRARKDAIFWISQSKADRDAVIDVLLGLIPAAADEESDAVAFALGQIRSDKAMSALSTIARDKTKSEKARYNAIFWIGQSKTTNRVAMLDEIYKGSMDNQKLRLQVAFALGQSKEPQAVTALGSMAANDPDLEVRKQAVFWLGQIKTPEALQQLENILRKK